MAGYYVYKGNEPLRPEDVIPNKPTRVRVPRAPFNPALCGTMDGHRQHRRHGQKQCLRCAEVDNEKRRERHAQKKAAQSRERNSSNSKPDLRAQAEPIKISSTSCNANGPGSALTQIRGLTTN